MPLGGFGRAVQSAIYQAGAFGHRPKVPTDGARLEDAARKVMSRRGFAYVAGSAGSEVAARANSAAYDQWQVVPRMLVDASSRDHGVELLGRRHESPLLIAPIGVLSAAHSDADLAVARAAREQAVTQIVSTQASVPMEEIARELAGSPHWYQLYWSSNEDLVESLVTRAEACGAEALVVTLDTTYLGWRPRDLDLGHLPFARGEGIAQYTSDPVFQRLVAERVANPDPDASRPRPTPAAIGTLLSMSRHHPGATRRNLTAAEPRAAVEAFLEVFAQPHLTWPDLARLRETTRLPIVLKGILHPDDGRRAVDAGVDAVYVSNHGGRQVDRAVPALEALVDVLPAVRERAPDLPVLLDSGVRTGADVFVALALGATAVGIGRPHVYGLALAGADGVSEVLRNLRAELDLTMALTGCRTIADITPDLLRRAQS
jgi:lactate 2-monooxygenase